MNANFIKRVLWIFGAVTLFAFAVGAVNPVRAAEFVDDGVIEEGEVIDDDVFLYGDDVLMNGTVNGALIASAATVTINGRVNGDVVATASEVLISDSAEITGNLITGASSITVEGLIGGSVAAGAAALELAPGSMVQRNVYFGGYSLEVTEGAGVERSVYVGGYQAVLNGDISQDVRASAAAVDINGTIGRDAVVEVGTADNGMFAFDWWRQSMGTDIPEAIAPGLHISSSALIGGRLIYTSPVQFAEEIETAPGGGVVYQTPVPGEEPRERESWEPFDGFVLVAPVITWLLNLVRNLVTLLLLGALALWLLPRALRSSADQIRDYPGQSAGYGLLSLLVAYAGAGVIFLAIILVGVLLSLLTLGGLSRTIFFTGFSALALAVSLFTFLVFLGSKVVFSYLIGNWMMGFIAPRASARSAWALVLGVIIYALVRSIPFVGWLIALAAIIFGLGGMWLAYRFWRYPPGPATVYTPVSPAGEAD